MGLADLVPGISGGTVALLGGVYYRLMQAISRVDHTLLPLLLKGRWKTLWQRVDGYFLVLLLCGMALAAIGAAQLIHYLLAHQPIVMGSLFLGLIMSASMMLLSGLHRQQLLKLHYCIIGILISLSIGMLPNATGVQSVVGWQYLWVFGAGFLAISAMVLPGISGSFILLMLGMYPLIIGSIANFNIAILLVFFSGCLMGILLACRVIAWLLSQYLATTMSLLTGLMIGSSSTLWPWKQTLVYRMDSNNNAVPVVEENLSPWVYTSITGQENQWLIALVVFALAALLVWRFGRITLSDMQ